MTFMPMQDNPMGGRNRLEDLAKLLLSSQQSQQPENSGVPTARVGGMDLLVNHTGANWGAVDNPLVGLAKGYLSNHEAQKKDQFMQGVQQVIQHPGSPDEKIGQLHVLLAQHGGNDYGLGLKDIIGQYDKSAQRNAITSVYGTDAQGNIVPKGSIPKNSRILPDNSPVDVYKTDETGALKQTGQVPRNAKILPNQDIKAAGQERQDKRLMLGTASELRKEFNSDQIRKDFVTINRAYKGIQEAYKQSINPDTKSRIASDQALGVLFQKMLDPQSVVRESEYARTPEGASFLNRLESILPQLQRGGLKISDSDRKALLDTAQKLVQSSADVYNQQIDRYSSLANQSQVDPQLIFGGIGKINLGNTSPLGQSLNSTQSIADPSGNFSKVGLPPNQSFGQTKSGNKFRRVP